MYYGRLWIQGSPTNDNAPIHMRNVACNGSETELLDCRYTSEPRCSHYQDVGVACVRPDLLLIRKEHAGNSIRDLLSSPSAEQTSGVISSHYTASGLFPRVPTSLPEGIPRPQLLLSMKI